MSTHRAAAKFVKWLCYVAILGSRCQKNKSVAIGNAWIGRFSFLIQKQNALTIQHSITNARQKEMRNGSHIKHGYSNEFLDSDRVANVYFTSDVDAKSRISSLNEFYRINLSDIRRAGAHAPKISQRTLETHIFCRRHPLRLRKCVPGKKVV